MNKPTEYRLFAKSIKLLIFLLYPKQYIPPPNHCQCVEIRTVLPV